MTDRGLQSAVHFIRQIADPSQAGDLPDGELLRRFIEQRDEAAFTVLVRRHGPLVLGVCQRVLHNLADSEDAFQATFLVLIRKARSIVKQRSVGSWLHGVAYRVAVRAKGDGVTRRRYEGQLCSRPTSDGLQELVWRDLRPVLDQEMLRLPARCRVPFILCYLEGRTTEEAAEILQCPRGTVLSRLARARELLRLRLIRRSVDLSCGLIATLLTRSAAEAAVPVRWADAARAAALRSTAGKGVAAGALSAKVVHLAEGVLRAMLLSRARTTVALLLAACLIVGGGGMLAQPSPTGKQTDARRVESLEPAGHGSDALAAPLPARSAEVLPAWGEAKDGVRIGIQQAGAGPGGNGRVQLSVVLENVSKGDVVLNFGIMLGNGKKQLPTAVRLTLTDAANKTRIFELKVGGIAGRVDPFVVPLPAGGRYTLRCVLDDYADADGVALTPGRYRATAEFVGNGVAKEGTNQDMSGLALMVYWTGTVASGEVPVMVPAQP